MQAEAASPASLASHIQLDPCLEDENEQDLDYRPAVLVGRIREGRDSGCSCGRSSHCE